MLIQVAIMTPGNNDTKYPVVEYLQVRKLEWFNADIKSKLSKEESRVNVLNIEVMKLGEKLNSLVSELESASCNMNHLRSILKKQEQSLYYIRSAKAK